MDLNPKQNNLIPENDVLLKALVELANELGKYDVPLIVGGGLSLYIRTKYLRKKRSPRYKSQIIQRSTKDIDVFLTSNLIIDPEKISILRDTIGALGYTARTKYFQFQKEIEPLGEILIDILSPPQEHEVNSTDIRIRPANVDNFHAHRNNEAKGISIGLIPIKSLSEELPYSNLFIVSSYNYIILKLHAFKDRLNDTRVDFGRYHAYDIFATVIDMDENDWGNAKNHFKNEKEQEYINSAIEIVREYFSKTSDLGIIRLKENKLYQRDKLEFDSYIPDFLDDLKEMFNL
ncbi:MAG: hypothetical protein ACM3MI_01160 [Clostridiales bacterium]